MRAARWLVPVAAITATACRPPVPEQTRPRPATTLPAPATSARRTQWLLRPSTGRVAYLLENNTILSIREDSALRVDSVASQTEASFTGGLRGTRISGQVLAYSVSMGGQPSVVPPGLGLPFPFLATSSEPGGQVRFVAPAASPCAAPALGVAQSMRDLWFSVPDTLRIGSVWRDSARVANCRDQVPFFSSVVRTFRVVAVGVSDARELLTVVRISTVVIRGDGAQSREPVTLSGSGGGELTYQLDVDAGEIVAAQGLATTELTLRGKVRTQVVRQSSVLRIVRRP